MGDLLNHPKLFGAPKRKTNDDFVREFLKNKKTMK